MALNLDHQRDRITTSTGNMTINTAGSLRIPVGNTSQRPQPGVVQTGQIRFNTQLNEFEGYNGTAWKNIGGVSDTDGDTFIDAEQSADDDVLRFFTAGSERITISDTGVVAISAATQSTTFNNGALTVAGGVGIVKDLNVGGNINVTGNVTVGGTINLGDDDTDNININADINSDLIPNINDSYDLGSATKSWKDLYLTESINYKGATGENEIVVPTNLADALSLKDDANNDILVVDTTTGAITITLSGSLVVPSMAVSDLTDNRIVVAGTNGELEDDSNFTFDGSIFKVSTTDAIVIPTGTTAQRPTAQTGMLRFNSTSGKAEIYNGSGWIDVGSGTGTVNEAFKTISVSGQSDVVADDPTDTLTFVAGTGITITTNAATDEITITGVAQYGDSDVDIHLNTSTAGTNEVLSWNGTDYAWVANSGGGSGSGFSDKIEDADGDTHVKVETNSDEDFIRFTTAGTERLSVNNTGILTIGDLAGSTYYKFPTARGTTGQVLALDGTGNLTFQTVSGGGGGGGSAVYYQTTAPSIGVTAGDLWFDTGTTGELYVYTGSEWISTTPGADASFITVNFTGTGSQTVFDTQAGQGTVSMVFLNGVLIQPTNDYTESNGVVTFVTAPLLNDQIDVVVTGEVNALTLPSLGLANHGFIVVDTSGNVTMNSVKVSDLTDNRIVIAGAAGELEDSANLTFDGNDLIIDTNSSIRVPVGTTAQRPTAATGQLRFNTTDSSFEGYDGTAWGAIGGGGELNIAGDSGTDVIDVENDTFTIIGGTGLTSTVTNNQVAVALDNTAVTPGSYGSTTAIPVITVDQQGRITAASTAALSVNKFATINITDTNSGYSFAQTGSLTAVSDSDSLTFLGGTNVDIDVDTTNNVIKIDAVSNSAYTLHSFTGTGSQTAFVTSNTAISDAQIYINGVLLDAGDYSIAANGNITFGVAPLLNDEIRVYAFTTDVSVFSLAALGIDNHDEIAVDSSGNVTLTGTLTLASDPTANLHAATKQYVDSADALKLDIAGGTMTGALTLSGAPTNASHAATKAYVDSQITAQDLDVAGDTGTGAIDLDSQSLTIAGTTNEIETSASGQTITVGLPNDVTIGNDLIVTGDLTVDTDTLVVDKANDRVGVGIATPLETLHVDGAIRIDGVSNLETASTSLSTTTQSAIDTFATTKFRSCKYTVQATDTVSSEYQVVEVLLIHDGTTAYVTTYGVMFTGSAEIVSFDADINSGNVRLLATGASANSTQYKITRISTLV